MKYYFILQYKMLNRHFAASGIPPLVGYLGVGVLFLGLSAYLFYKTEYAPYFYAFAAVSFLY